MTARGFCNSHYRLPTDCNFESLTNTAGKSECSPQLIDRFSSPFCGIAINLPSKVLWPADVDLVRPNPGFLQITTGPLRLMLAGLVRFDNNNPLYRSLDGEDTTVVAVDQGDGSAYCGRMPLIPSEPAPLPDMLDPFSPEPGAESFGDGASEGLVEDRAVTDNIVQTYFNLDLVGDLNIPIRKARYVVYATLGIYVSNICEVETEVV